MLLDACAGPHAKSRNFNQFDESTRFARFAAGYNSEVQLSPDAHDGLRARDAHDSYGDRSDAVTPPSFQPGKPLWRSMLELLLAFGIVVLLANFLVVSLSVASDAMTPTLRPSQRVLVSRLPYRLTTPQRGDLVAVRNRIDPSVTNVYRVVGLPGDQLDIKGAQVVLNGQPLREPYLSETLERLSVNAITAGQYRVGKDQYFLLNDNRFDLNDSRSFGMIRPDEIVGRAWLVYWPLQNIAPMQHTRPNTSE